MNKKPLSFSFFEPLRRIGTVPVKYLLSSILAFVVNYVLLLILEKRIPVGGAMELAAIIAWLCSSYINFSVNRRWVFHADGSFKKAFLEYYSLAVVVFVIKTFGFLEILTRLLHLELWFASPVAEVLLFVCNYLIQKKWIFKRKPLSTENNAAQENNHSQSS